jgi:hypothetical protein
MRRAPAATTGRVQGPVGNLLVWHHPGGTSGAATQASRRLLSQIPTPLIASCPDPPAGTDGCNRSVQLLSRHPGLVRAALSTAPQTPDNKIRHHHPRYRGPPPGAPRDIDAPAAPDNEITAPPPDIESAGHCRPISPRTGPSFLSVNAVRTYMPSASDLPRRHQHILDWCCDQEC